jgi:hypothetical protein
MQKNSLIFTENAAWSIISLEKMPCTFEILTGILEMQLHLESFYFNFFLAEINVSDILSTPMPMGGNRLKKEYFRTPGQVISLTSHFAFVSIQ